MTPPSQQNGDGTGVAGVRSADPSPVSGPGASPASRLGLLLCWPRFGREGRVNIPAVGARVRLRGREGVVSRASLGTVKRLGDEFVSSGAWIEVMLTDGKGYIDLLKLHESAWDDSSCSTPERRVVALFGRVLARQSGRLWDHGADRRRDAHLRAPGRSLRRRLAAARLAALLIPLAEDFRL